MKRKRLNLLFADDEVSLQELMRLEIPAMGHSVTVCPDGTTAIAAMKKNNYDCLLVDLDMPGANGLEVIEAARELNPNADSIIMTGKGTLETAIQAIREGTFDYLTKPCRLAEIEAVLKRVADKRELTQKYLAVKNQLERAEGQQILIGTSEPMQRVQRLIDKIAPTDSTVVILGETGTGKELAARAVHDRSTRSKQPFVAINCGALPENLIESELFGHKKGSFTGADAHRTGLLEVADGGTLFLDEIGELPKGVQAKFLRFLESKEVRRIGENSAIHCDVRVVCATLRNLEQMVQNGEFREDLWFRINTFEIQLPPLRERIEDLSDLVLNLTSRFPQKIMLNNGKDLFTPAAWRLLENHSWPGNVRQLANVIEHSLILSDSFPIDVDALPRPFLQYIEKRTTENLSFPEESEKRNQKKRIAEGKIEEERNSEEKKVVLSHNLPNNLSSQISGAYPNPAKNLMERLLDFDENSGNERLLESSFRKTEDLPNTDLESQNSQDSKKQNNQDSEIQNNPILEGQTLKELERMAIQAAIRRNEGNKSRAAEELGISLKTLYNKLSQSQE